jgi:NAD(P)-dependent dehydrogenase (short-subunit alcohol dehydrogenase family)
MSLRIPLWIVIGAIVGVLIRSIVYHACWYLYCVLRRTEKSVLQTYTLPGALVSYVVITGATSAIGTELLTLILRHSKLHVILIGRQQTLGPFILNYITETKTRYTDYTDRIHMMTYTGLVPTLKELNEGNKIKYFGRVTMVFHLLGVVKGVSDVDLWTINYHTPCMIHTFLYPHLQETIRDTSMTNPRFRARIIWMSSMSTSIHLSSLREYVTTKVALEYYAQTQAIRSTRMDTSIYRPGVFESRTFSEEERRTVPHWMICTTPEIASSLLVHGRSGPFYGHWRHLLTWGMLDTLRRVGYVFS